MDQSQVAIDATNKLNLVKQRLRKTLDPELSFRIVDQSESELIVDQSESELIVDQSESELIGQLEKRSAVLETSSRKSFGIFDFVAIPLYN